MMIDLVKLRTFVAVAEEQHLTRAAERLHISQSAASAHVRSVEETLDAQVFIRTNRSLELTRAGQLLMAKAKLLLSEATEFSSFARELRGKIEGHLVVASSSDPTSGRVGEIVNALRIRHPLVTVDLRARPSSSTHQGLKIGELDIGVLLGRPIESGITYYKLRNITFRVAGPAAWRDKIEHADWRELARLPWILPTDNSMAYKQMLREMFEDRGLELNGVVSFDNAVLGRSMLEAGVGMMLVREDHAKAGEAQGLVCMSSLAVVEHPIYLAHVAGRRNDPMVHAFLEATTDVWPDLREMRHEDKTFGRVD